MPLLTPINLTDIPGADECQSEYSNYAILDYSKLLMELAASGIDLMEDPVESGIINLNGLIAQIDAQKTRAANIVTDAIMNENGLEAIYKTMQGIYKREFDAQLVKSPAADFSNAGSREAAASSLLTNLKSLLNAIEGSYSQARTFTKVANADLTKLDSTNKNISRQITVLQLANEIGEIKRQSTQRNYSFDDKS